MGRPLFDLWDVGEATLAGLRLSPSSGETVELAVVVDGLARLTGELLGDELPLAFLRDARNLYVYRSDERDRELARYSGGVWRCRDLEGQVQAGEILIATRELIERVWRGGAALEIGYLGPRSRPSGLALERLTLA